MVFADRLRNVEAKLLDYSQLDKAAVKSCLTEGRYGEISESLIEGIYEHLLGEGDSALDVGVHFGRHLFPMHERVGKTGLVYGVEANPERYIGLVKHIAKLDASNVQLLHAAASDSDGVKDFFINVTHSGRSGLRENKLEASDEVRKISVLAAPLSHILPRSFAPRFMKIDIEGAEFPALLGARDMIARRRTIVVYEGRIFESAQGFGFEAEAVKTFFVGLGYAVFDLFGNRIDFNSTKGGAGWNFVAASDDETTRALVGRALTSAWGNVLSRG